MDETTSWEKAITINRASIRPLYLQLKEALESWLVNGLHEGTILAGERLPSENELADKLALSNITVKRALDELRRQGLIQRIQGRGSFVIGQQKLTLNLLRLFSLTRLTRERGMQATRVTLETSEMTATPGVAARLDLPNGARVSRLVRLRLMDKIPVAVDTTYLPVIYFPNLLTEYNDRLSLYDLLARRYQHEVVRTRDLLGPVLINPFESKVLEVPVGSLGIIFERTGYDLQDTPVEVTKTVFRGDLCNFVIDYTKEES